MDLCVDQVVWINTTKTTLPYKRKVKMCEEKKTEKIKKINSEKINWRFQDVFI